MSSSSSNSSSSLSKISEAEMTSKEILTSGSNSEYEEDDQFEDGDVMTARPPDGITQAQSMAAFDVLEYLDQLIESNTISNERGLRLKRKYTALVESIETSRDAENTLLMKIKELQIKLAEDHRVIDRAEGFPDSCSSEVSRARQNKLLAQSQLMESEEMFAGVELEIQKLREESKQLQLEVNRMPQKEDVNKRIDELKKEVQVLQEEIAERNLDLSKLNETKKTKETRIESVKSELEQILAVEETLKAEVNTLSAAPLGLPREIDKLIKAIREAKESIDERLTISNDLVEEIERQTRLSDALTEELSSMKEKLDDERRKTDAKQVGSESLAKNIASGKEHESTLIEEEASLDLQLKLKIQEYKLLHESVAAKTREKDKEMKHLKKADIQLRSALNGMEQQHKLLEPFLLRAEEVTENEKKRKEAIISIRQEVESFRRLVAQQIGFEHVEQRALSQQIEREKDLRDNQKKSHDNFKETGKEVIGMTRQRDIRSRDFYKALHELHDAEYDLKIKKNQIEDQQKKLRDLDNGLRDFADAYNVVKAERNKAYSQIQACQQLSAEMREKIKVLHNESEILQNAVDSKSKVLARAQLALISKNQDRDSLHHDLSKVRLQQDETHSDLVQQREILYKLTQQINAMEQSLNRLRVRYEHGVQDRNDTGLQLIERNEEVCVFHEKLNVQDSVCRKGNMSLMEKEEEIKFLNMEVARLNGEIDILRKTFPDKEVLERKLFHSQNQLSSTKELIYQLEERVTDASNPERVRLLEAKDPSCAELREKVEKLQARLTDEEQKVLEKELHLEQVIRLVDRLKRKVDGRQQTTLKVGNKVNHYHSKINDRSRKMMALISELSLQQALAIRLQQEVNEKETQLEQAYSRLESGEAPDEESAKEWAKVIQKREMKMNRSTTSNEQFPAEGEVRELPNGSYTTAEPRPNAYIPESDIELPLPKPYGAHAPFKPTQPGANMRHIRNPEPKPIDI